MIAKYPPNRNPKIPFDTLKVVHADSAHEDESNFAWVHWLFQRLRGTCSSLMFSPPSGLKSRNELLDHWKHFIDHSWNTLIAPGMLHNLKCAELHKMDEILALGRRIQYHCHPAEIRRSLEVGAALLEVTEGAKYQGMLGQFRTLVAEGKAQPQLISVWGLMAYLFQMSPQDTLLSYLMEEWCAATRFELSFKRAPFGSYGFHQIVKGNLKAGMVGPDWHEMTS